MTTMTQLRFELDQTEAQIVELYGIDDYLCCYEGSDPADLWQSFLIAGGHTLAERMKSRDRQAGFLLEDDELVFAFEMLDSMSSDSPLDGCDEAYRQRAYDLLERLRDAVDERRHQHWVRIYDEGKERDRKIREAAEAQALREREIKNGRWRAGEPQPPLRPSSLA